MMQVNRSHFWYVPEHPSCSIHQQKLASFHLIWISKLNFIARPTFKHLQVPEPQSWQHARQAINSCTTITVMTSKASLALVSLLRKQKRRARDATTTDTSLNTVSLLGRSSWKSTKLATTTLVKKLTTSNMHSLPQMLAISQVFNRWLLSAQLMTILIISGYARPNFVTGGHFGGKDVDRLYTRATQRETIGNIVGSYDLAKEYIEETSDVFLGKLNLVELAEGWKKLFEKVTSLELKFKQKAFSYQRAF